jgi:hypothetical protein
MAERIVLSFVLAKMLRKQALETGGESGIP